MAKISEDGRHYYIERIKPYKTSIDRIFAREKDALAAITKEPDTAPFIRLTLAEEMLNLFSNYMVINGVSEAVLKIKNEDALNDGRKSLYKSLICLEQLVSNYVDAPFADYEEKLEEIASIDAARRHRLIRKMGFAVTMLETAYGDHSKWKWSFVELEGRYAAVAKNMLDLKNAVANTDPRSPHYEPTVLYIRLIKKLLAQAADRYRQKYELSTNHFDDFRMGINFLGALRRIYTLMGDREDAEEARKKMDSWNAKLEADIKRKKEEPAKKK
ncbi:MAG: hypothetical protein LBD37_06515 [Treponema sp.]|jgi:hypothetical protein|nr:hypothetical protein [Treponema sp.]